MAEDADKLRKALRSIGLTDDAISAAWPAWWTPDAGTSASANAELRFSLAKKLGIDPRSLLSDAESPAFIWHDHTKFKNLTTESDLEKAALSSFGISVARALETSITSPIPIIGKSAFEIRDAILAKQPFVRLVDLLGICWAGNIPVIHLRLFPLPAKRMCAMAVHIAGKFAIILGKDANYPAPIAYYLAHELGHIAKGHLQSSSSLVDLADPLEIRSRDAEEVEADEFALELLTGRKRPIVYTETRSYRAAELARVSIDASTALKIEPGTLALCFGHSTGDWAKVFAAMRIIYDRSAPVWKAVNLTAERQLEWSAISDDLRGFLESVLGLEGNAKSRG